MWNTYLTWRDMPGETSFDKIAEFERRFPRPPEEIAAQKARSDRLMAGIVENLNNDFRDNELAPKIMEPSKPEKPTLSSDISPEFAGRIERAAERRAEISAALCRNINDNKPETGDKGLTMTTYPNDINLPEIDDEHIVLFWDSEVIEGEAMTVVRYKNLILWKDRPVFEGYKQFAEVVSVFAKKYGNRLVRVVPTRYTLVNLYGDSVRTSHYVVDGASGPKSWKESDSRIVRAIKFAIDAHDMQDKKGTFKPYIEHPLDVGGMLNKAGCDEDTVIAGYLHDTVEDTIGKRDSITLEKIAKSFGFRVAGIVEGCTEDKTKTWNERKRHTLLDLKAAPIEVKLVTCADKLNNVRAIAEDLITEGDKLWSRFNQPRKKQQWYYRNIVKSLSGKGFNKHPLFIELKQEVAKVFPVMKKQPRTLEQMTVMIISRVIGELKRMKSGVMSGEMSGLVNVWEEICVQAQGEESIFWDMYLQTIDQALYNLISRLRSEEKMILWLATDSASDWDEDEDSTPTADENDIVNYLRSELLGRASDDESRRVRNYIDSQYD